MKKIEISLAARYAAAFGSYAIEKLIDKVSVQKDEETSKYNIFKYYPERNSDFEKVKFTISDAKKKYKETLEFSSVLKGSQGNIFAPPLLMSFSQEKSLIETEVNDDDPVIIERWGTKPWNIDIKGLLIDLDNRIYPSQEIRKLTDAWSNNNIVEVTGLQFEDRKIDAIYFKSINFEQLEGFQDTIQFSIQASSIKNVSFTLGLPNVSIETGDVEPYQLDGSKF